MVFLQKVGLRDPRKEWADEDSSLSAVTGMSSLLLLTRCFHWGVWGGRTYPPALPHGEGSLLRDRRDKGDTATVRISMDLGSRPR